MRGSLLDRALARAPLAPGRAATAAAARQRDGCPHPERARVVHSALHARLRLAARVAAVRRRLGGRTRGTPLVAGRRFRRGGGPGARDHRRAGVPAVHRGMRRDRGGRLSLSSKSTARDHTSDRVDVHTMNDTMMPSPEHERDLTIYGLAEGRRQVFEQMMWQVPALGLTAQAFLLTIALDPGSTPLARGIAAPPGFVAALAGASAPWL